MRDSRASLWDTPIRLWLDDERTPPEGWEWAKDAHHALSLIRSGLVIEASLDHDLGDDPWTGYWLLSQIEADVVMGRDTYTVPTFTIHSANPVGHKNMQAAIDSIESLMSGVAG